jgi:hypothetical protein
MTTGTKTRASNTDRKRVVEILQEQTAQGRLTIEEFQDRTDAAYLATTWQDLAGLAEDLPVRVSFDRAEHPTAGRPAAAQDRAPRPAVDRWSPAREPPWRRLFACCCGWTVTRSDA